VTAAAASTRSRRAAAFRAGSLAARAAREYDRPAQRHRAVGAPGAISPMSGPAVGGTPDPEEVERLLGDLAAGDPTAEARLVTVLYDELHRLAAHVLRTSGSQVTLQTTALVHEAWLRLSGGSQAWTGRRHFLSVAAKAMRHVLVDRARARRTEKRGGGARPSSIEESAVADSLASSDGVASDDVIALDDSLARLAALHPRLARIVELRFFAGLTVPEVADVLGASASTVEKDWTVARAWLLRDLSRP